MLACVLRALRRYVGQHLSVRELLDQAWRRSPDEFWNCKRLFGGLAACRSRTNTVLPRSESRETGFYYFDALIELTHQMAGIELAVGSRLNMSPQLLPMLAKPLKGRTVPLA